MVLPSEQVFENFAYPYPPASKIYVTWKFNKPKAGRSTVTFTGFLTLLNIFQQKVTADAQFIMQRFKKRDIRFTLSV